jgi:CBS domain-containing protein
MIAQANQRIAEVMSTELKVVAPGDKLEEVDRLFASQNIHHIPVQQADGKLVGIISKSDFLQVNHMLALFNAEKYGDYNQKLYKHMKAEEIMTEQVITLGPDQTLADAAAVFKANDIHALPVVQGEQLVGIITTHDLLNICYS